MSAGPFEPDPTLLASDSDLSEGCRCCRRGRWLCVFLTYRCNVQCDHCPAPPSVEPDRPVSEAGSKLYQILVALSARRYGGVAFSGGEALLAPDRLGRWLLSIHDADPALYLWLYTNGLAASPEVVEALVARGLDEIRFNIHPWDYLAGRLDEQGRVVARNLARAAERVGAVAIEVPVIPGRVELLLSALPRIVDAGVRYLNLHEFIPVDGSPDSREFALTPELDVERSPEGPDALRRVVEVAHERYPELVVNPCTHEVKRHQMAMRRRAGGA
jgi:pyruvate formate-lyase activating enzyme-like uncharacterized protein